MARSSSGPGNSSRGGSRRGQNRTDFNNNNNSPQQDGWTVSAPPRHLNKVGDLGNFGTFTKRGAAPTTFGPSGSVFNKRGGAKAAEVPALSRNSSSSNVNMFQMLSESSDSAAAAGLPPNPLRAGKEDAAPEATSPEPAPQRKRLNLAPRSVPIADAEASAPTPDAEAEAEAPAMDAKAAAEKIKANVAEIYHIKVWDPLLSFVCQLQVTYDRFFVYLFFGTGYL